MDGLILFLSKTIFISAESDACSEAMVGVSLPAPEGTCRGGRSGGAACWLLHVDKSRSRPGHFQRQELEVRAASGLFCLEAGGPGQKAVIPVVVSELSFRRKLEPAIGEDISGGGRVVWSPWQGGTGRRTVHRTICTGTQTELQCPLPCLLLCPPRGRWPAP